METTLSGYDPSPLAATCREFLVTACHDVSEVDVPDRINADPYEPLVFLRWLLAASRRAHQACWLVKPDLDGQGPAAIYQKVCGAGG